MGKNEEMHSFRQADPETQMEKVKNIHEIEIIQLNQLKGFKNHPFKVEINTELFELMQSIERDGILVPLLARPSPDGNGFELISGHRRKAACEWAGITEVPVIICDMDDNQAIIAMVDSNLQREHIKPSEKAFAFKMRLEAMKKQGIRTDLTSCQVGKKLNEDNPTVIISEVEGNIGEDVFWEISHVESSSSEKIDSNKELAMQYGESQRQINRYIRLTNLIPQILDMVDEEKIAFTVAVELSYLKEEEQYELHSAMDLEQCTPSLSQANRIKRMSQSGTLDMDMIYDILEEEKPNQKLQIKIKAESLEPYFPSSFTEREKVELIEKLVKEWHSKHIKTKEKAR